MRRKHGKKLGAAGAVACALFLATQSPAAADETRWLEQGWDTARLDLPADRIKVKDYECDGNGVYVMYKTIDSGGWEYHQVWDQNGCSGNGWWEYWADDDIEGWVLCESRSNSADACSAWDNL